MNKFYGYQELRAELNSKYGEIYAKYPHAMAIIERALSHHVTGRSDVEYRVLSQLRRFGLRRWLHRHVLRYFFFLNKEKHFDVIDMTNKFKELSEVIEEISERHGLRYTRRGKKSLDKWINFISPISYIRNSAMGWCLVREARLIAKYGVEQALLDNFFLQRLEDRVKKEVNKVIYSLKKIRCRIIIAEHDSIEFHRILCEAAHRAGVKYIVIAHGYAQDPYLVGFAPIRADKLIVWTEDQKHDIQSVIDAPDQNKIEYIGFPKYFKRSRIKEFKNNNSALLIFEPIHSPFCDHRKLDIIKRLISKITSFDMRCIIRLHPSERNNSRVIGLFDYAGVSFSEGPIENSFDSAQIVLGSNSSALIESHYYGCLTLQVSELKKYSFSMINEVSIDQIDFILGELPGFLHNPKRIDGDNGNVMLNMERILLAQFGL